MRYLFIVARILFILSLPVLLLTSNLRWAVNEVDLYTYGFDRYGVSETSGIDVGELRRVAGELVHYFDSEEESLNILVTRNGLESKLFSERETVHFKDVKDLVQLDYRVQMATLAYVLAFTLGVLLWRRRAGLRELAVSVCWGSISTLGLMALLGIGVLIGFDRLFLGFHMTFFSNDLWMAQPGDVMAVLFPEAFFRDAAAMVAGATVAEALLLGVGSWLVARAKLLKNSI
ncbi:TIGR01906 family membrane protein [Chloroflexota bacterium]